jgi:hypothetical protein
VAGQTHHRRSGVDPSDHQIKHARTEPTRILCREGCRSCPGIENQIHLWRSGKREAGLQGSLHPEWHSAPSLLVDC